MAAYRRVDDLRSLAGWLPVHGDQLRAQRSVSSMGSLYLFYHVKQHCTDGAPSLHYTVDLHSLSDWQEITDISHSEYCGNCQLVHIATVSGGA